MNKQKALDYCYKNRGAFIRAVAEFDPEDAVNQFDCLVTCVEYENTITDFTKMLSDHGMCDEDL